MRRDIEELKRSKTPQGTRTKAEFYSSIQFVTDTKQWTDLFKSVDYDIWFCGSRDGFNFPDVNVKEMDVWTAGPEHNLTPGTQTFVNKCLQQIMDLNGHNYFKVHTNNKRRNKQANLHYDVNLEAFKSPTIGTRKSDVVFYDTGKTGELSIVFLGDVKQRQHGDNDFRDDEKGHILDLMTHLLTEIQIHRKYLFGFLTDGLRFQFFKAFRAETSAPINYSMSQVYDGGFDGWQVTFESFYQYIACITCVVFYRILCTYWNNLLHSMGLYLSKFEDGM